jgi:hypothetical protein
VCINVSLLNHGLRRSAIQNLAIEFFYFIEILTQIINKFSIFLAKPKIKIKICRNGIDIMVPSY